MKIHHLIDSGGFFGAEAVVLSLAREQVRRGHDVAVVAMARSGRQPEIVRRCLGMDVAARTLPVDGRLDVASARSYFAAAERDGIDIVHSHGYKANTYSALFGRRGSRPSTIGTLHGWTGRSVRRMVWWYESIEKRCLARLDVIVGVHSALRDATGMPESLRSSVIVIPNGADVPSCDVPRRDVARSVSGPGLARVGFVGRLAEGKGLPLLVQSMQRVLASGRLTELLVVGEGPLRATLQRQAEDLGVAEHVKFLGYSSNARELMASFEVLALPSDSEGLPMVILEALSVGVPVVASNVGGCRDLLDGGRFGLLIEPGSIEACAAGIIEVLSDVRMRERVRAEGPAWVRSRYSIGGMADGYEEAYALARERRLSQQSGAEQARA